jgi:hypothetical protein
MKRLLASAAVAGLLSLTSANAQSTDARVKEITNRLAKIDSINPIERIVASEGLLASEDPTLRSLALPKILASNDGRVRAVGFSYLVDVQKKFNITVAVPDKKTEVRSPNLRDGITNYSTFTAVISEYEKPVRQFKGSINYIDHFTGTVATDGLTFLFSWVGNHCRMQFRTATADDLTGSLDCGPDSFLITSPLP